jgi:RNA polymerase sigma-70 factor (ECF subfamily)
MLVSPAIPVSTGACRSRAGLRFRSVSETATAWDEGLVARIAVGDDSALATLYDQYAALVHGIAVRLVGKDAAADVCQEVFASLWNHPDRWDSSRGSLRTFLAVVARRRAIDHLRSTGRRTANEQRAHLGAPSVVPNVDEAAMALSVGDGVRKALSVLPAPQREAIELAYFGGLTFRQVAEATGASEGTAKSRIRLGLRRLSEQLGSLDTVGQR